MSTPQPLVADALVAPDEGTYWIGYYTRPGGPATVRLDAVPKPEMTISYTIRVHRVVAWALLDGTLRPVGVEVAFPMRQDNVNVYDVRVPEVLPADSPGLVLEHADLHIGSPQAAQTFKERRLAELSQEAVQRVEREHPLAGPAPTEGVARLSTASRRSRRRDR